MTVTELKEILEEAGVVPSKKLGQNFLIDQNIAAWIVAQLEISPDETVVEIGPGTGALSEYVVEQAKRVILIEFDRRLAAYLTQRFSQDDHVTVIHHDAVTYDVRELFQHQPIKLIGNLPYSAGGAILRNFLKGPSPVTRAILMLSLIHI